MVKIMLSRDEIKLSRHELLGTVEEFEVGGIVAKVADFGNLVIGGDCSNGVCTFIRVFSAIEATSEVLDKYNIDIVGYNYVYEFLKRELEV